jgi:hypothetical protein
VSFCLPVLKLIDSSMAIRSGSRPVMCRATMAQTRPAKIALELQQPGGADQAQAQHVEHHADDRQRPEQRQRQREQPDVHPLLRQRSRRPAPESAPAAERRCV